VRAVAAAALIAQLSGGCSLIFVRGPSGDRRSAVTRPEYPSCDEGTGAVAADIGLAALGAIATGLAASEDDPSDDTTGITVVYGLLTGLFIASTWHGAHATGACASVHRDWEKLHANVAPVVLHRPAPRPAAPATGQQGAACYGNRTCNPGLACDPTGHCVAGTVGLEGMACFADGRCSGDLWCSLGRCVPPRRAECTADAHCPSGQICRAGACLLPPTSP
jgi:Cys-rich repeat protein